MITTLVAVYGFIIGACLASFLCVCVERKARGESISGRSHCVCGRQLKNSENVPIFGWLKSGGKAKCCGSQIPKFYVIAEIVFAIIFATLGAVAWLTAGAGLGGILAVVGVWLVLSLIGYVVLDKIQNRP